jgi:DNA-binding transcriptional LysR family regulator
MIVMNIMHTTNLCALDLNLLRSLDALLVERHLTRAAKRVGLSQPAMSHGLSRLRSHFNDPLFIRGRRGLEPTARALQLAKPLREAMALLERALSNEVFDPKVSTKTFSLATADYGAFVLLPRLIERLAREAPKVDHWTRTVADDPGAQLARGDVDAMLTVQAAREDTSSLHTRQLFTERFVCVVREGHPRVRRRLDLDTWIDLPHCLIAPRGMPGGIVDHALAALERTRRVACAVPHFLVAPHIVANTDLVLTVGERVAHALAKLLPLRVVAAPVELPGFAISLTWHELRHHDVSQRWYRAQIVEAAKTV